MAFKITKEAFDQFLEAKGIERECVECGANEWQVAGDTGDDGRMYASPMSLPDTALHRYAPAYILFCRSCGIIKLIMGDVVEDWSKAREQPE